MVLEALQVGLIISIAGITAIILFSLYLLDQLTSKVKSVEASLKENEAREKFPQSAIEARDHALVELEARIQDSYKSMKELVENNSMKTNDLRDSVNASSQSIEKVSNSILDSKQNAEVLKGEVSKLARKYDEVEQMLTDIVKRSLQSRSAHEV